MYYGLLIQAVTDKCVIVYRWTHSYVMVSVYKWKQTEKGIVGQKPRRGNKWRRELKRKKITRRDKDTWVWFGSLLFYSRLHFRERDTLRTSHNIQPPTVSHHVHFLEHIFMTVWDIGCVQNGVIATTYWTDTVVYNIYCLIFF